MDFVDFCCGMVFSVLLLFWGFKENDYGLGFILILKERLCHLGLMSIVVAEGK